ncbi:MAG: molybdopterin dinucleotide binding domain-containing protein [Anaerolineae bacterium]
MSAKFTLITGRTRRQADGLHEGKDSEAYRQATEWVDMNPHDMARLGIKEQMIVEVRTPSGQVRVPAHAADLPPELLFMPLGPAANVLIGSETEATGTPLFKGPQATIALASSVQEKRQDV